MLGRKKERGEGKGRKKYGFFSSLYPPPTPLLLTRPIFSRQNIRAPEARPKKTPELQASDERAHARNISSNLDVLNSEFERGVTFSLTKRGYKHILTMNRQLVSLKYDYHNARNTKLKAVRVTLTTTLASFTHNLANQKIEFSLYLTTSRLRVPKQQQQQYLLAFP